MNSKVVLLAQRWAAGLRLWGKSDTGWMQTFTGKAVWPDRLRMDDIDIADIAHALSMQCRYNGHVQAFYSTAEHCCHICDALKAPHEKAWGLMHDAGETYTGDIIHPLRRLCLKVKRVERRIEQQIAVRYGLGDEPPAVKAADTRILVNERTALMASPPLPWVRTERLEPLPVEIQAWAPERAKAEFLKRYEQHVRPFEQCAQQAARVEAA